MLLLNKIKLLKPLVLNKTLLTTPEAYLTSSIILETACTVCLPKVIQNKLWYIPIYTGYGVSFYLFPKALDKFSLNLAYTLWSGFGIIFTFMLDILLKKETFHIKKLFGIFTVIYGIYMIK
jgi:small multidrug resistance pump|tara:strand:- start:263 stop:625 length:363 start_codon:yes stop_codon:yes gene_type:complete